MPMSKLYDNHGREISYLRLAVTDRCNLRCFYCMPEEGINYVPRQDLLSYEEMERLVRILVGMGIRKVRITGGEPFLRKNIMEFLTRLHQIQGLETINLTTNGTLTEPYLPALKKLGIQTVNLSLDTLDAKRFFEITRRDTFDVVMKTMDAMLKQDFKVKINTVVMAGRNTSDILSLVELAKNEPIDVRFIEEMPFNGSGTIDAENWNYLAIHEHIRQAYPEIQKIPDPNNSTAYHYHIPGFKGNIGIIAAYSRTFCGTCNRIRLTPSGVLRTCLYDDGVFNLRDIIRAGATDEQLVQLFLDALGNRAKDGREAEQNRKLNFPIQESMSTIGG